MVIPGVRSGNYYLEPIPNEGDSSKKPEKRLGFIHVDYGASPETIVWKVRRIISRAYSVPAFSQVIQKGKFVVAIVAPTEAKVEEIKIALLAEPPSPVFFRIQAHSDLAELLSRRGRLKDNRARKQKPARAEKPTAQVEKTAEANAPTPATGQIAPTPATEATT